MIINIVHLFHTDLLKAATNADNISTLSGQFENYTNYIQPFPIDHHASQCHSMCSSYILLSHSPPRDITLGYCDMSSRSFKCTCQLASNGPVES